MNLVVAVYDDWGIGKDGTQPIVVPEDRKHFRDVTGHGTVIVGRKTLADFPGGRPLKNRRNIVMSRDEALRIDGAEMAHSAEEVLSLVAGEDPDQVFVIGGASVYQELLPFCRKAYVTFIGARPQSDAFLLNLDRSSRWRLVDRGEERFSGDIRYRFRTYINRFPREVIHEKT